MTLQINQSLISAGAVILGVVIGGLVTWLREAVQEKLESRKAARYLAIRVVCLLDELVDKCVYVAADHGTADETGYRYANVKLPTDSHMPIDVDWKTINHDLMYRILSLKSRIDQENRAIYDLNEFDSPPDFSDTFEERHWRYAGLGLHILEILKDLRKIYKIPSRKREPDDNWDEKKFFLEKRADIQKSRDEHKNMIQEMRANYPEDEI